MAKRAWLFIAALFALADYASLPPQQSSAVAREIAQMEEDYSQSLVTGNTSVAQRLLAEDFIGFDADTTRTDKARTLAEVKSLPLLAALRITSLTVRQHGDTVLALGEEEDTLPDNGTKTHWRWIDTRQKTPLGWRLLASAENEPKPWPLQEPGGNQHRSAESTSRDRFPTWGGHSEASTPSKDCADHASVDP